MPQLHLQKPRSAHYSKSGRATGNFTCEHNYKPAFDSNTWSIDLGFRVNRWLLREKGIYGQRCDGVCNEAHERPMSGMFYLTDVLEFIVDSFNDRPLGSSILSLSSIAMIWLCDITGGFFGEFPTRWPSNSFLKFWQNLSTK